LGVVIELKIPKFSPFSEIKRKDGGEGDVFEDELLKQRRAEPV
jgi:hypothetical protein